MISTLQEQIEVAARTIATDSYAMSIGELINMYRDEEIDIHPEFQRAYRWGIDQKSKLIESILLGIPMPPILSGGRSRRRRSRTARRRKRLQTESCRERRRS